MKLIIVESPNKIKKIRSYAGDGYEVAASVGHIRDLVTSRESGSIGIDRQNGYKLLYDITPDKKEVVANLRSKAKAAGPDNIYLATDPDREGEAIAWHLCVVLGLDPRRAKRITFQEITERAIKQALASPRTVDLQLVAAQEGRRAIDRLVGFSISPVLQRKIAAGLSAGRVQSVAVRLVVEREREIGQFLERFTVPVAAQLLTAQGEALRARRSTPLDSIDQATTYLPQVGNQPFQVLSIEQKPTERQPSPAFSTSTLQQEGVKKLRLTVQQVADLAQKLFEQGHITYIRTDSVNLSEEAMHQAQQQINQQFGADQHQARRWKNKDGAQEAHEAIRPTHWENPTAGETEAEQQLYRLIYMRALASQMVPARYAQTTITLAPGSDAADTYTSSTRILTAPGYLTAYQDSEDEDEAEAGEEETATLRHPLTQGAQLQIQQLDARQSYARPPKRYNEATIVADLEKRGIGRPSTYASILKTIFARQYVQMGNAAGRSVSAQVVSWSPTAGLSRSQQKQTLGADKNKVLPTATGTQVTEFLEQHFARVMDYTFTAGCEAIFDKIATGQQSYREFVPKFDGNLMRWVGQAEAAMPDRAELQKVVVGQFEGQDILLGHGKRGPYLLHAEKYYDVPAHTTPAGLSPAAAVVIITERRATAPRELGAHQGKPVVVGQTERGTYLKWQEQYYRVPEGIPASSVTLDAAARYITEALQLQQANTLATVGKYTVGRNEWGLYVSDGVVKAKFKPGTSEEEARAITAEQAAEMIKNYKAWKKKNQGGKSDGKGSKSAAAGRK